MNKRILKNLSIFNKIYVLNTKNLQIITRQGTKIGEDNAKTSSTILQSHEYPNLRIQRKIFNNKTQVFKELATQEYNLEHKNTKLNVFLQLLSKEGDAHQLVDLLNMLKDQPQVNRQINNVYKMNQVHKFDLDPQVYLDIEGVLISQVFVNFGSQVNILPRCTWMKHGRLELVKSIFNLKLADQGLVEPLGIWKDVGTTIMCISMRINFEVIEPNSISNSYPTLIGQPWERKMKSNMSLDKNKIKIKGKGKRAIIPLNQREGFPWDEIENDDAYL